MFWDDVISLPTSRGINGGSNSNNMKKSFKYVPEKSMYRHFMCTK